MKNKILYTLLGVIIALALLYLSIYSFRTYREIGETSRTCSAVLNIVSDWEEIK